MARIKAPVVITANDLLTGEVVYLDPAHQWSPELSAAKVFGVLDEAEGELAAVFREAVGPFSWRLLGGPAPPFGCCCVL